MGAGEERDGRGGGALFQCPPWAPTCPCTDAGMPSPSGFGLGILENVLCASEKKVKFIVLVSNVL